MYSTWTLDSSLVNSFKTTEFQCDPINDTLTHCDMMSCKEIIEVDETNEPIIIYFLSIGIYSWTTSGS